MFTVNIDVGTNCGITVITADTVFTVKQVTAYLSGVPVNTAYTVLTVFTVNIDLGSNF